jgi:hypothetical protein
MFLGHIILQVYVVTICGTCDTISNDQHFEFYSYISTFLTICVVPNMAVFYSFLISSFSGMLFGYF